MALQPVHVTIEGIIGAGKSSLLRDIQQHVNQRCLNWDVYDEPVETWRNFHGRNVLDLMYKYPDKYAFMFQTLAFSTKLLQLRFEKPVVIAERSIVTQARVFIPLLLQQDLITPLEKDVLDNLVQHMETVPAGKPNLILHLKVDPVVAMVRIAKRDRPEEKKVTLNYLQQMEKFHDQWLGEGSKNFQEPSKFHVIELDGMKRQNVPELTNLILQYAAYRSHNNFWGTASK